MKKYLLILVALFAISMTSSAQRDINKRLCLEQQNKSKHQKDAILLSNNRMSVYIKGYEHNVCVGGPYGKVIGKLAIGEDKHGNIWVANLTDKRYDVDWYWHVKKWNGQKAYYESKRYDKREIMDPWEISQLRMKDGSPAVPNGWKWDRGSIMCIANDIWY